MKTEKLERVTALTKANVYFDGKVLSHTLLGADGSRTTLGIIFAGEYHFNTGPAEDIEIVSGGCRVRLDGSSEWQQHGEGARFSVPAKAGFDIVVAEGITEYVCVFSQE